MLAYKGVWFAVLVEQREGVSHAFHFLVKRVDFYHAFIIRVSSIHVLQSKQCSISSHIYFASCKYTFIFLFFPCSL